MKYVRVLFLVCLLSACSSPKFYKYAKQSRVQNEEAFYDNREFDYEVLKIFENISENPDHIIYLFVNSDDMNSTAFEGMIYDVDNQKYYRISNPSGKLGETLLNEIDTFDKSDYCQFIISTYLADEHYLKWLINNDQLGSPSGINILYDIDSKEKTSKRIFFGSLFFIDDIPCLESKEGKEFLEFRNIPPYKP